MDFLCSCPTPIATTHPCRLGGHMCCTPPWRRALKDREDVQDRSSLIHYLNAFDNIHVVLFSFFICRRRFELSSFQASVTYCIEMTARLRFTAKSDNFTQSHWTTALTGLAGLWKRMSGKSPRLPCHVKELLWSISSSMWPIYCHQWPLQSCYWGNSRLQSDTSQVEVETDNNVINAFLFLNA